LELDKVKPDLEQSAPQTPDYAIKNANKASSEMSKQLEDNFKISATSDKEGVSEIASDEESSSMDQTKSIFAINSKEAITKINAKNEVNLGSEVSKMDVIEQ